MTRMAGDLTCSAASVLASLHGMLESLTKLVKTGAGWAGSGEFSKWTTGPF